MLATYSPALLRLYKRDKPQRNGQIRLLSSLASASPCRLGYGRGRTSDMLIAAIASLLRIQDPYRFSRKWDILRSSQRASTLTPPPRKALGKAGLRSSIIASSIVNVSSPRESGSTLSVKCLPTCFTVARSRLLISSGLASDQRITGVVQSISSPKLPRRSSVMSWPPYQFERTSGLLSAPRRLGVSQLQTHQKRSLIWLVMVVHDRGVHHECILTSTQEHGCWFFTPLLHSGMAFAPRFLISNVGPMLNLRPVTFMDVPEAMHKRLDACSRT
jgi:hypothetical protein